MVRNKLNRHFCYIAHNGMIIIKVCPVSFICPLIPFAGKEAIPALGLETQPKTTYPGKKVYKGEISLRLKSG